MSNDLPPRRIAYVSMEVGLEARLPTYSGGLGVLAGDTLRAAADLSLPVAAITLVHREGYFRQSLDEMGGQSEAPAEWDPSSVLDPVEPTVSVEIEGRSVEVRAWRYDITGVSGSVVPVYLLDTDLPSNDPSDRRITDTLYGGDARYRLIQETVLGYGGVALMRALESGRIRTWHLNEGHCSLVPMALLEADVGLEGLAGSDDARDEAVRRRCVFTTHTPVPAGHDRFPAELVESVLGSERARALEGRGTENGGVLNMTELGLHFSRFVNGVAMRHAQVSREMFPGREIQAITNGVHVPTWTCGPMAGLFDRHVPGWRHDPLSLRHAVGIPLDDLRQARRGAKGALVEAVRERTGAALDPGAFTLGFARRATPYKRADLLFDDTERLRGLAREAGGIQVVFAGKAHPRDEGGKALIRSIHEAGRALAPDVRVVYLEDYDMDLGLLITSGVDLWLNNPEKPKEASGTSGMKAALNGVPNLSTLDGWWIEGHVEGVTGWSVADSWKEPSDRARESGRIYEKLGSRILPLFRDGGDGFDRVRRHAIALNGPQFSARRMMHQYVELAYGGWRGLADPSSLPEAPAAAEAAE